MYMGNKHDKLSDTFMSNFDDYFNASKSKRSKHKDDQDHSSDLDVKFKKNLIRNKHLRE